MIRFISTQCPVCSSTTKGCCATDNGLHICRGSPLSGWKRLKSCDNGFSAYRRQEDFNETSRPVFQKKPQPVINWDALVERYKRNINKKNKQFLSSRLGVPDCFDLFNIGIVNNKTGEYYTIPERDVSGYIGVSLRQESDKTIKSCVTGSKRGLCVPDSFFNSVGPVYIVEGFSDCAAMVAAGINCIGRPSNVGGSDMVADICAGREVIVVGENDWRLCRQCSGVGCSNCNYIGSIFPGLVGAYTVSKKLASKKIKSSFLMPPKGYKDCRDFLVSLNCKWSEKKSIIINSMNKPSSSQLNMLKLLK
jgi:hypothetical protein